MADGDVKDYAGEKKKPSLALVISVGPKMPKKPEDTSKPNEPMKKAWHALVSYNGSYDISKNEEEMDEEKRRIMEMLPPIPPQQERRNMMRDGTQHSPGQQSMIDRATEMLRQAKIAEAQKRMKKDYPDYETDEEGRTIWTDEEQRAYEDDKFPLED